MKPITNYSIFNAKNALFLAFFGAVLLTGITTLAHIRDNWNIEGGYHIIYSFTVNLLLLFIVLIYSFAIIKSSCLTTFWKYILSIVGSLILAGLLSFLFGILHQVIYNSQRLSNPDSVNLTRDIVASIMAILISVILFNFTRREQLMLEKEQLQKENLTVKYEALVKQMDPHFLFNSLNTLSALIDTDTQKAQDYLHQLASTYRYIMQGKRVVLLSEEMSFVDSYCRMMQIRYGDNMHIEQKVDERYLDWGIPPISIQLLIENVLKHNVVSSRHPMSITMITSDDCFHVTNTLHPKSQDSPVEGLGLANLAKRYSLLSSKEITITQDNNTFRVDLPLIEPAKTQAMLEKFV